MKIINLICLQLLSHFIPSPITIYLTKSRNRIFSRSPRNAMTITGIKFRHFLQIVLAINPAETQLSFPQYFPYESYSDGAPHPLFVVLKNNPSD